MEWLLILKAILMGLVEGVTEFLPISSTGHLIILGDLIDFLDKGRRDVFEVAIQLGAILAICWEYRARLIGVVQRLPSDPKARGFVLNLLIAFLPAAVMGVIFISAIKSLLFYPVPVACALLIGGFVILWLEKREHVIRVHSVDDMTAMDAFKIGCAQCLALIPGTSRSGATIMGGLFFGFSRTTAAEFSFFLAIPTMFAATFYDILKHRELFEPSDFGLMAIGFIAAFISALLVVRALMKFIANHSFIAFAFYRIGLGILLLGLSFTGVVNFSAA